MEIKPIRTERDYRTALAEIERLFDAKPRTPAGDRLEVLAILVEAYEDRHHPILPPDPIEAILYFMESRGLTRKDLEPYIGSRAKVSEVLNRKRSLSIEMIRRLHEGLGIPAEVLIQPYDLESAPTGVGTDVALAAVKSAVTAGSLVYEPMSKSGKQGADLAAKVTAKTVKGVGTKKTAKV